MKTLHIAIALCFVIFGTAACADKSTSECADTPRGDLDYAPDEELLSGKCLAERGRKILATDKIKAQGALSNLVTMYKWGEHQVAGEEGLGIVIKAHGCPTILPFVESMPKSSDSGYKLKWLHLMTLCGPGAKPVADIIKSLFDDPDKSVREQSFLLYTNLGLPLPLEYSSPTGITPQKEAEYKSAIDKAYEYATAVSTTGPEKAMTALENTIKNTPKYAAVAKLYLLLGRLKKEHQQNRDYAKSHPTEYTYFSIGDDYFYNGKQFTDLIARFSGNDLADDAGYELTKLSDWNDCEDDVGCGIESQLNPVLEFLKGFPDSEYSWKAVIRANEAFTSHRTSERGAGPDGNFYKSDSVRNSLKVYDTVASSLPPKLKTEAYLTIASLWTELRNNKRAIEIFNTVISESPDGNNVELARKKLAEISTSTKQCRRIGVRPQFHLWLHLPGIGGAGGGGPLRSILGF